MAALASGARREVVCITGFGPFQGVADNPSAALVQAVQAAGSEFFPGGRVLARVLEVSMAGAREGLDELEAEIAEDEDAVMIHLGVYGGETRMRLEYRAFNVADFRCPDQRNEAPKNEPVESAEPLGAVRATALDLDALALEVAGVAPCAVTDDPGRFVCNYLFYCSLARCARHGRECLFLHVPQFEQVPMASQFAFLRAVVGAVHRHRIARPAVPQGLCESLVSMGFSPEQVRRAYLCSPLRQREQAEALLQWLLESDGEVAPLEDLEGVRRARRGSAGASADDQQPFKVVVVVNESLQMSAGKTASQVGHAVLALWRDCQVRGLDGLLQKWLACGETLVVVRSGPDGIKAMRAAETAAMGRGLPSAGIRDAGRTEVAAGSYTVLAVGPGPVDAVDGVTGRLRLL
jgi:peptidyl-tRNA hydrolase